MNIQEVQQKLRDNPNLRFIRPTTPYNYYMGENKSGDGLRWYNTVRQSLEVELSNGDVKASDWEIEVDELSMLSIMNRGKMSELFSRKSENPQ